MSSPPSAPTYQSGRKQVSIGTAADIEARAAAFQFLGQLAAEVTRGNVNLPCFPDIVLRVRKALSDPANTPEKTVKIVGAEPRLAARLLQTANSAVFNPSGKPLTDLRTAVTRLGHQLVQSATMALAVQQMKSEGSLRAIAGPLSQLWAQSVSVAAICQVLARRTKVRQDEAFLTGLLHGIGHLYIMVRAAGESAGSQYDHVLAELVGSWHPSIGKAVLETWGFAAEMCDAVGNQLEYERKSKGGADLTDVLIAGIVLADALGDNECDFSRCASVPAFAALGLAKDDCMAILKHTRDELGTLHDALGC
ncbi:MAG: HDOD domain-containing protein [Steroidobacteraceae bacterium]